MNSRQQAVSLLLSRTVHLLLALALTWPFANARSREVEQPGLRLVEADETSATLALRAPAYRISELSLNGELFHTLDVPGAVAWGAPGAPQLPAFHALLGVPPGARVVLEVVDDAYRELPGSFRLSPAPSPVPLSEDLEAGRQQLSPAPGAYVGGLFPESPAVLSEDMWYRDQRLVRVSVFPFQYDPEAQTLIEHSAVTLRVRFLPGPGISNTAAGCAGDCTTPTAALPLGAALLNAPAARAWRSQSLAGEIHPAHLSAAGTSAQTRYKIVVDQDGLYRLTYGDLVAAGLDLGTLDPQNLRLTSQGQDVAIHIEGEGDNSFDPADSLLFYGQAFRGDLLAAHYAGAMDDWLWLCQGSCELAGMFEKYTDENVYWLWVEGPPGPRMATVDGDPAGSADPTPDHYTATVRAEQSHAWYTHHFTSEETWFWERVNLPTPFTRTYTTTLTALAAGPLSATVGASVVSRNTTPGHHVLFFLNDGSQSLDDSMWDGKARRTFSTQVSQADLDEGENDLHMVVQASGVEDMYFDWFEITFGRQFQAQGDQLYFPYDTPGSWKFQVDGLASSQATVLDVSDPLTPLLVLNPQVGAGSAVFKATTGSGSAFLVAGAGAELSPDYIQAYTPVDYDIPGADYVVIGHPALLPTAQTLADYRAGQGLSTLVVSVEELYDQFNFGIYNPIAIKNFLAYAFANWSNPPTYAVLVGGGHWNLKGYSGYANPPIYMPPNLAFVDPWQGEVDSANLLATLVGSDPMPDLVIGRMPADSVAELQAMISKVIAYEASTLEFWENQTLFITDDTPDPAGDFVALAEAIIDEYLTPSGRWQAVRVYQDDYGDPDEVTAAILDAWNQNEVQIVNYLGHASVDWWAHDRIFVNADIALIQASERPPVILSMTCLDGYWIHPNARPSLVVDLLKTPGAGAVSSFSATGLGVATGHDFLQRGFYDTLLNQGIWDLGLASLGAKANLLQVGGNVDLLHTFTVFGDPALQILEPPARSFLPVIKRGGS